MGERGQREGQRAAGDEPPGEGLRWRPEGRWAHPQPFLEACPLEWHQDKRAAPPFPQVLRQYGINLSEEEFFHILEYYDKTLSSKLSYNDFLRAFLQ